MSSIGNNFDIYDEYKKLFWLRRFFLRILPGTVPTILAKEDKTKLDLYSLYKDSIGFKGLFQRVRFWLFPKLKEATTSIFKDPKKSNSLLHANFKAYLAWLDKKGLLDNALIQSMSEVLDSDKLLILLERFKHNYNEAGVKLDLGKLISILPFLTGENVTQNIGDIFALDAEKLKFLIDLISKNPTQDDAAIIVYSLDLLKKGMNIEKISNMNTILFVQNLINKDIMLEANDCEKIKHPQVLAEISILLLSNSNQETASWSPYWKGLLEKVSLNYASEDECRSACIKFLKEIRNEREQQSVERNNPSPHDITVSSTEISSTRSESSFSRSSSNVSLSATSLFSHSSKATHAPKNLPGDIEIELSSIESIYKRKKS